MTERRIERAHREQASRLFDIMLRSVEIGCAGSYPPEVIEAWNRGRTVEAQEEIIAKESLFVLLDDDTVQGFVHLDDLNILGLFVDPNYSGRGCGSELLQFALRRIEKRPVSVQSSLNVVAFYEKHGFRKVAVECDRRHERDICAVRMELR